MAEVITDSCVVYAILVLQYCTAIYGCLSDLLLYYKSDILLIHMKTVNRNCTMILFALFLGCFAVLYLSKTKLTNFSVIIYYGPDSLRQNQSTSGRSKFVNESDRDEYLKGFSLKSRSKLYGKMFLKDGIKFLNQTIHPKDRLKRGVFQLYNMLNCATDCNPMTFKGYGCFCGFLGSGNPVDDIDKCCKMHDSCYEVANCPMYLEYFVPYYWKCIKKRPICALNQAEFKTFGPCSLTLCECDRVLSECLKRYSCPTRPAFCTFSKLRFLQNAFMFLT